METYTTESGYTAKQTIGGIDIYDDSDAFVCELSGRTLAEFEDEDENINEDQLDEAISEELEVEEFLDYQEEYC